jgi:tRNA(Met) C34 N-acetyltransferase TmcA
VEVIQHRHAFAIFSDDPTNTSLSLKSIFDQHDQPLLFLNGTQSQKEYLGKSLDHTLIDLTKGVDFDAFSCIIGAVQGGSILIFLFDQNPIIKHRAYLRLMRIVKEHITTFESPDFESHDQQDLIDRIGNILIESKVQAIKNTHQMAKDSLENQVYQYAINDDQAKIIHMIYHSFKSQSKKQIALIAPRGRGKSASIGIAIALLLLSGESLIYLSAQDENQIQAVLVHAKRVLENQILDLISKDLMSKDLMSKDLKHDDATERLFKTVLHLSDQKVVFVPVNALVFLPKNQKIKLIIDEASTIDLSILEKLSVHQILYSSTVGGYEGHGRTLALKFLPKLKKLEKYTLNHSRAQGPW